MSDASRINGKSMAKVVLSAWLLLILVVAIWQLATYQGFASKMGEWQFSELGGYFPDLVLAILILLFGGPAVYLLARREPDDTGSEAALRLARRFFGILLIGAVVAALFAASCLWTGYAMVRSGGREIKLHASQSPPLRFNYGMAQVTGHVLYDRQVDLSARTWFFSSNARFAPVVSGGKPTSVTYILEVDKNGKVAADQSVRGLLVRDGLRLDAVRLLEDNGYQVARPHYVLFTNAYTLLRPYQTDALKWGGLALLLALLAAYQYWRMRHVRLRRTGSAHFTR